MRLCILTTSFPRHESDDSGIFVGRLADGISKLGITGMVLVPRDFKEPKVEERGRFKIERVSYGLFTRGKLCFGAGIVPNLRARPILIFQAPALLLMLAYRAVKQSTNFDLIHANWISAGIVAWVVNILTKKPYVLTLRGEDARLLEVTILKPLLKPVVRRAAAVTSVNRSFLQESLAPYKVAADKLFTIPNGVELPSISEAETEAFALSNNLRLGGKNIIFVGSVIPRKRVELLIELLARPHMREHQLILCGRYEEGYFGELIALAEKRGCISRIHWKGLVSPKEIPFYLRTASVYISASRHEGRPNAIIEAFAARIPVIASDIVPHREIITDGINGFLASPENTSQLEELVHKLDSSAELRSRIVDNAYSQIKELTWESCAQKYLEVFKRIIAPKPSS